MSNAQGGPQINLVLGVSSVGKSSYMAGRLASDPGVRVVLAHEITRETARRLLDSGPCSVHYNMLRPHNNDADLYDRPLHDEPAMAELLARRSRIAATVLVARPATIAKRILLRGEREAGSRPAAVAYPAAGLFEFVCRVPVSAIYERWFELLSVHAVPFRILSAEEGRFDPVRMEAARNILAAPEKASYSPQERLTALGCFSYKYQRLDEISHGHSMGADRSATLDAIRPHLAGRTALDIGCGEGFFCFALEKAGFAEVIGTEVNRDRFRAACAVAEVTGSRCRFLLRDVFAAPLEARYDTVLLLNVLHHLRDPIRALELAAAMCTERLIVEFPTPADEKFAANCAEPLPGGEAVPLIGVGLMSRSDQTFLFSPEALRRICLDHARLFATMTFAPSPLSPTRRLAICTK